MTWCLRKKLLFWPEVLLQPSSSLSPSPLIEQGGKRQLPLELQRKLPPQYDGKYTNHCWKMGVFVQQPGLRWLTTDWANWRWLSLMTYVVQRAVNLPPLLPISSYLALLYFRIPLKDSNKDQFKSMVNYRFSIFIKHLAVGLRWASTGHTVQQTSQQTTT